MALSRQDLPVLDAALAFAGVPKMTGGSYEVMLTNQDNAGDPTPGYMDGGSVNVLIISIGQQGGWRV